MKSAFLIGLLAGVTLFVTCVAGIYHGKRKTRVCEGKTKKISCPNNNVIQIHDANYGRTDKGICRGSRSSTTTSCRASASKGIVWKACHGIQTCTLVSNNRVFGDPCYGVYKFLSVTYSCAAVGNGKRTSKVCEGKSKKISCPNSKVIQIHYANYGRTDRLTCPGSRSKTTTSCRASVSKDKVMKTCNGRQTCTLVSNNRVFGDPCYGVYKFLSVTYSCAAVGNGKRNTKVCEGKSKKISCPNSKVIQIHDANYGRTDRLTCPGTRSKTTTSCRASVSKDRVRKTCNSRQTCTLVSNNRIFGDPCYGVYKFLSVTYSCAAVVNGGFTKWSGFTRCNKVCGGGTQERSRSCTNPSPAKGGRDCVGARKESRKCNIRACPVNGGFTKWSGFTSCSKTCGVGIQERSRSCTNPIPQNGGRNCVGARKQSRQCNKIACPAIETCTTHVTKKGKCCVFPFIFRGVKYNECTVQGHLQAWCGLTSNYDEDNKFGFCTVIIPHRR